MKIAVAIASLAVVASAHAFSYSLTPLTTVTQSTGLFSINGTIAIGAGETFNGWNRVDFAFTPSASQAFNGVTENIDPAFAAWTGTGTYSGGIWDFSTTDSTNFGYSGGMPVGLYNFNPASIDSMPGIDVGYTDASGLGHTVRQNFAVEVVAAPEPASMAVLGLGALTLIRRRRAAK